MSTVAPAPGAHFLARIVASAQGAMPVITPRLPSVFEPAAAQLGSIDTDAYAATEFVGTAEHAVDARIAQDAADAAHARDGAALTPQPRSTRDDKILAPVSARASGMRVAGEAKEPARVGIARSPVEPAPPAIERGMTDRFAHPRERIAAGNTARDPGQRSETVARRVLPVPDSSRSAARDDHHEIDATALVRPVAAALVAKRLPVQATITPAPNSRENRSAPLLPSAPAPRDVHIRIGRIEIRAATVAQPVRPAQTQAETTSARLEAYLARKERSR